MFQLKMRSKTCCLVAVYKGPSYISFYLEALSFSILK